MYRIWIILKFNPFNLQLHPFGVCDLPCCDGKDMSDTCMSKNRRILCGGDTEIMLEGSTSGSNNVGTHSPRYKLSIILSMLRLSCFQANSWNQGADGNAINQ
jgi:hypothetical protein